jgi:hypothetical protein
MPLDDIVAEWRRRVDTAFVASLAGVIHDRQPVAASADRRLVDGRLRADTQWLRVWGLPRLFWAWDDTAMPEVRLALDDEAWRVREMAFNVISHHPLGDFTPDAADGRNDRVARVRKAACRALAHLTASRN